jgi:YgiT-type zinc finger domain-containing protein
MRKNFTVIGAVDIPDDGDEQLQLPSCKRCGSSSLQEMITRSAFWDSDRLVVIENVPALVCASCHEQHYDDETVVRIDLLRGEGFPVEQAVRHIAVPVFSLFEEEEQGAG